jgi:hypothetical protein
MPQKHKSQAEVKFHSFLSSELDSQWSPSSLSHFTPEEITPGTHSIGGLLGPRNNLDVLEKRKTLALPLKSNPRFSSP